MERSTVRSATGSAAMFGVAGGLFVASAALFGAYVVAGGEVPTATLGSAPEITTRTDAEPSTLAAATAALLAEPVTLTLGDAQADHQWSDLGVMPDEDAFAATTEALAGKAPSPAALRALAGRGVRIPVKIDRERALNALLALKAEFDRAPTSARLDLEEKHIFPAEPGYGIDVYASVSAIEAAARSGQTKVALAGAEIPPSVTIDDLGISDISHVLGHFRTKFKVRDSLRNDNLKLVASRINGYVLQPGATLSFNDVVGARTEKEGYKIAPVITAGQLVDGLAGGTCQISTTLHGAAFFAGLEIVKSTPHSRPSHYVTMGLDATVVYPYVDLVLKNPYDFPVAIHYRVARGESIVEILGQERPYDKVVFERFIKKELPFDTVTREDNELPIGSMVVDQAGFKGYLLERDRKFYRDGKMVKRNKWNLRYAPVTEYVRMGINPDPNLAPPKNAGHHGLKPPKKTHYIMTQ